MRLKFFAFLDEPDGMEFSPSFYPPYKSDNKEDPASFFPLFELETANVPIIAPHFLAGHLGYIR